PVGGNHQSAIYRKYFRDRPSITAIGAYDIILHGNKNNVLFRCDNPDGNCALEGTSSPPCTSNRGWGGVGHGRGGNASDETVICELSYQTRRSLSTMCALTWLYGVRIRDVHLLGR
ncbi:hypothetical protein P175DRAFT_0537813, partial [Aspergillus ochraceoroseus IBT 24754]